MLRITYGGNTLPGADNQFDLGSTTKRWANIYSADLQLSNIGTGGNEVDGTQKESGHYKKQKILCI